MNSLVLRSQRSSLNGPVPLARSKNGEVSFEGLLYFFQVASVPSQSPFLTAHSFDSTGAHDARIVSSGAYGFGRRMIRSLPRRLTAFCVSSQTDGRIVFPSSERVDA